MRWDMDVQLSQLPVSCCGVVWDFFHFYTNEYNWMNEATMSAGSDRLARLARSFRSWDVLACGCLAISAIIIIGASHAVHQTQWSCRQECPVDDEWPYNYWFERTEHECERSCGDWNLPFRLSQLALTLMFLAVSCLRPWVCTGCSCDEPSRCLVCLGCCALVPVALLLLPFLLMSGLACPTEGYVTDISQCDYVGLGIPLLRRETYILFFAGLILAACCCLAWARLLIPEKRDGAQPVVTQTAENEGEPTQIVGAPFEATGPRF
ncbi:unnamed protein product, partial [Symbiodinium microadriaticum]